MMKIEMHNVTLTRTYNDPPHWVARYTREASTRNGREMGPYTAQSSGSDPLDACMRLAQLMGDSKP